MRLKALILSVLLVCGAAFAQPSTKDVQAGVVGGTITAWDSQKLTIRGVQDEWTIYLDPHKTLMQGHPSVDNPALIWFTKGSDGNLWAQKVFVPQTELWPTANMLFPGSGQIKGQVTQYDANTIVLRANGAQWTFAREGKNTLVTGNPTIDSDATVWYHKADNGTMYAKKIQAGK